MLNINEGLLWSTPGPLQPLVNNSMKNKYIINNNEISLLLNPHPKKKKI